VDVAGEQLAEHDLGSGVRALERRVAGAVEVAVHRRAERCGERKRSRLGSFHSE